MILLTLLALACTRGEDSSDSAGGSSECGDVDGPDGPVPNVLGNWTVQFGQELFDTNCQIDGYSSGDDFWVNAAINIGGRVPNDLMVTFGNNDEHVAWGIVSPSGSVALSGTVEERGYGFHASVGGMAYYDPYRERTYIDGFGFVGVDTDGDPTTFECNARGDWTASKSGAR